MKKLLSFFTAALMLTVTLTGCSAKNEDTSSQTEPELYVSSIDLGQMRGLTAKEIIADMTTGWNLGNSLDAIGTDETAWGNPATTKEMIDMIHEQGFDILRVPVTWANHMSEGPDYKVSDEFMARVHEVVDYGIANGMYVILDTHHEPDSWLLPQSESMDKVKPQFEALWKQIAESFRDYGDHLIFEGMNEPRIKGGANEWNGGTDDGRACVNELNRLFVDTVRATGGNNEKRVLLVTTFAQQITELAFKDFVFDYDEYVGVALHAYTPYSFTYHSGESYETYEWDGHEASSIKSVFQIAYSHLLSKDIPVIITEYGAVRKTLSDKKTFNTQEVCKWLDDYLGVAKELGIPCVWWDNNAYITGGENFGIFDRNNLKWYTQEVADKIISMYEN